MKFKTKQRHQREVKSKSTNYYPFPNCIPLCISIRNLKRNFPGSPIDQLYIYIDHTPPPHTHTYTPICLFQSIVPQKSWWFSLFISHALTNLTLVRSSSSAHWKCPYQGHYPSPNPMSVSSSSCSPCCSITHRCDSLLLEILSLLDSHSHWSPPHSIPEL